MVWTSLLRPEQIFTLQETPPLLRFYVTKRGYGNYLILDHGFGYKSIYAHLSDFNVRVGQKVQRGDVIGYVGNTGTSVANHLHYEIKLNGTNIDPVNFYFEDLSPEEYDRIIEIASKTGQSFD